MQLDDFNEALKRGVTDEEGKHDNFGGETNYGGTQQSHNPNSNRRNTKVAPEGFQMPKQEAVEEEDENIKTEEDAADFLRKLGSEPYINFAEFAKYLSLFNPKTGIEEKIQCKIQN